MEKEVKVVREMTGREGSEWDVVGILSYFRIRSRLMNCNT